MGVVSRVFPVKLVIGVISKDTELFPTLEKILNKKFGIIDFRSEILPFFHTQYYQNEFGDNLKKYFLSFNSLINPERISDIKVITNKIENKFSQSGKRRINIDPGYLCDSKLVLVTTKNYSHRIYLKKGIYAELTLIFKDNKFTSCPWTYPDFQTEEYGKIFKHIRSLYMQQLKLI